MVTGSGRETMYKREIDSEFIAMYIASSTEQRKSILAKLEAAGITEIGGRPIEKIIRLSGSGTTAVSSDKWLDTGLEIFKDDIPITDLLVEGEGVPVAAPAAAPVAASSVTESTEND